MKPETVDLLEPSDVDLFVGKSYFFQSERRKMAAAVKRLDALFRDLKFEGNESRRYSVPAEIIEVTHSVDKKCDVHGGRRGSSGSVTTIVRRGSVPTVDVMPPPASLRRRDSLVLGAPIPHLSHPSSFPATLRRDSLSPTPNLIPNQRRDSISKRRFSTDSLEGLRRNSWDPSRRGSSGSSAGCEDPIWEDASAKIKVIIFVHPVASARRDGQKRFHSIF